MEGRQGVAAKRLRRERDGGGREGEGGKREREGVKALRLNSTGAGSEMIHGRCVL